MTAQFSQGAIRLPIQNSNARMGVAWSSNYPDDGGYIPSDIGSYTSRATVARQVSAQAAQRILDNGGRVIGRIYHTGRMPNGNTYGNYGYTVLQKKEPAMGGWAYSTPTWDSYGPATHDVFGVSGVSIDWWVEE